MIHRTFFQLITGVLLPRADLLAASSSMSAMPPSGSRLPLAAEILHPEWLEEWRRIPRLEIAPEDLPDHNDFHQRTLAAQILPCIQNGMPFSFCYLGGSEPGVVRTVLPVQLFYLDYFTYFYPRCEDPSDIPDPEVVPFYLLAWCQSRNAPRTFRLDRMRALPHHSAPA